MRLKYIAYFIIGLLFYSLFIYADKSWKDVNMQIAKKVPNINTITTEQLKKMYEKSEKISVVDVRNEEEYKVSHLKNAINKQSINEIVQLIKKKNNKVILYCSVGYRSGKLTQKLAKLGYKNVYNLKGSIFEWANKGYELYCGKTLTKFVHPYNKAWGKLLLKKYHKYK